MRVQLCGPTAEPRAESPAAVHRRPPERGSAVFLNGILVAILPGSPMANQPTESTHMSTMEIPVLEDGVWITGPDGELIDRKSTRLNSSHHSISYAVFCLSGDWSSEIGRAHV